MALYLNLRVGEGIRIGDAEIFIVEKPSTTRTRLQIDGDREQYPIVKLGRSDVDQIWEGPPIFKSKS